MDSSKSDLLDPYKAWLGIPTGQRPPNHYDLLGLHLFESEMEIIRHAADERAKIVRPRCLRHRELGTEVLNQIAKARVCLTDEDRKANYDKDLRERHGTGVGTIGVAEPAAAGREVLTPEQRQRDAALAPSPQLQRTLVDHTDAVTAVAFGKYSRYLASASRDGDVRIWDLNTGRSRCTKEKQDDYPLRGRLADGLRTFATPATCAAFSHDGTMVASGAYDGKVRIWDVKSGELQRTLSVQSLDIHRTPVTSVVFRNDDTTLASASPQNLVRVWNVETGELFRRVANPTRSVVFSPDGRILASTDGFWDFTSDSRLTSFGDIEDVGDIACMAYDPAGCLLASGSLDCGVRLWDAAIVPEAECKIPMRKIGEHEGAVQSVAFSPDGAFLASSGADTSIMIWDAVTGAYLNTLRGHSRPVLSVAFSPDGVTLASGSADGTVRLWEVEAIERQSD